MRISLNNTQLIERYLDNMLNPDDRLLFEARLILSPALRMDLYFQKKVYFLVKMYHRKKVKEKMEILHQQIFSDPSDAVYRQNIYQLFKTKNL